MWLSKQININTLYKLFLAGENSVMNKILINEIKKSLSPYRFNHTVGVAQSAVQLATLYGADQNKAEIAAILHDTARELDSGKMIKKCEQYGIVIDEIELHVPDLLHGKVGACIAEEVYGITDAEILNAVKYHTTGRKKMTLMDKIIFIADMIEPGRQYPGVDILRKKALQNLDQALIAGLNSTIRFVLEKGMLIHPNSIEARNYLIMSPLKELP